MNGKTKEGVGCEYNERAWAIQIVCEKQVVAKPYNLRASPLALTAIRVAIRWGREHLLAFNHSWPQRSPFCPRRKRPSQDGTLFTQRTGQTVMMTGKLLLSESGDSEVAFSLF